MCYKCLTYKYEIVHQFDDIELYSPTEDTRDVHSDFGMGGLFPPPPDRGGTQWGGQRSDGGDLRLFCDKSGSDLIML